MKKIKSGKFLSDRKEWLNVKSYFNVTVSGGQLLKFICFLVQVQGVL